MRFAAHYSAQIQAARLLRARKDPDERIKNHDE
jgi:hypothetical protein